ncbi:hypothetical protein GZH49_12220 [Nocardia terpenica]|uniref:hypothetical protein n=1 Tax=Nocardia terpenica TaxID=455432 RepID=UPI002FE08E69
MTPVHGRHAPSPSGVGVLLGLLAATLTALILHGSATATAQPATPPAATTPVPTPAPPPAPVPNPLPGAGPARPSAPAPTGPAGPQQPGPATPGTSAPAEPVGAGGQEPDCGVRHISGCVQSAIDGFFRRLVDSALNPLLDLLGRTLLTTPEPLSLPRVAALWDSSWQMMLASYGLLVMVAGILLMVHQTLQTRWDWQQFAPRIVAGFVAGTMSMLIATQAVRFANALAATLAGDGVDSDSATAALRQVLDDSSSAGSSIFISTLLTALLVMVTVLLVTYAVRVTVTIVLIIAAPLLLMCHALPVTEPIARWWWRAFGTCLAIQVVQSLTLVTVLRVFLAPGGWGYFGPNRDGAVNIIVAFALIGMLIKIPFWLLSALKVGGGRSLPATIVRSVVMYKTMKLLKGGASTKPAAGRLAASARPTARAMSTTTTATRIPDPYATARTGRDGQMMLPLGGVHRVPRQRTGTPPSGTTTAADPGRNRTRGTQLAFDLREPDPYRGNRPLRGGQYPLPIPVRRVPTVPTSGPAAPPPRARRGTPGRGGSAGKQLAFEFHSDPYKNIRPLRGGQYPLPLDVRRTPRPAPPLPPAVPPRPPTPPAPPRRTGRQLPLPDMPTRRRTPPQPRRDDKHRR